MTGCVIRINEKGFGFIKADDSNTEYFFHKEDFNGHFKDLEIDMKEKVRIFVSFEIETPEPIKGPRARRVSRMDYPNQAV